MDFQIEHPETGSAADPALGFDGLLFRSGRPTGMPPALQQLFLGAVGEGSGNQSIE